MDTKSQSCLTFNPLLVRTPAGEQKQEEKGNMEGGGDRNLGNEINQHALWSFSVYGVIHLQVPVKF
jgi:hypothetical protein